MDIRYDICKQETPGWNSVWRSITDWLIAHHSYSQFSRSESKTTGTRNFIEVSLPSMSIHTLWWLCECNNQVLKLVLPLRPCELWNCQIRNIHLLICNHLILLVWCWLSLLLKKHLGGSEYVALDTMCQYWRWLKKTDEEMTKHQKPFLSVFHAKGHQWKCQASKKNIFPYLNDKQDSLGFPYRSGVTNMPFTGLLPMS